MKPESNSGLVDFPAPVEWGLPSKFTSWRDDQLDAINKIADQSNKERFSVICAPTGFGKSLMYVAASIMSGKRAVILTSTKGLQDQLRTDFGLGKQQNWLRDLRGMSNYKCKEAAKFGIPGLVTVEQGPCHSGAKCDLKSGGCEYYDRYREANMADLTVTNYAMWMHDRHKETTGLMSVRPVDILVLDEAHDAPDQLADHIAIELTRKEVREAKLEWPGDRGSGKGNGMDEEQWKQWATFQVVGILGRYDQLAEMIRNDQAEYGMLREAATCKRISRKLSAIAGMRGDWVIEGMTNHRGEEYVRFDPLWPSLYAESVLFRGIKRVILVSATVRPKTLQLLGVSGSGSILTKTPFEGIFTEYQSTFPVERRPVIHVPTVQMNFRNAQDQSVMKWWLERIDTLIDGRMDRKGVIHTVSYKRAQLIKECSRHSSRMLLHDSKTRTEVVALFKSTKEPMILVSPSVDTGYDFPGRECEFQIIGKIPFPDNRAKVIKRRMETDKDYGNYVAAQTLVQMTGRGMRSAGDKCETLIVDDNVEWFVWQNRKHIPKWWMDSYREATVIPTAPERLP